MAKKSTSEITTISFKNQAQKNAAIRKAKVRHDSLSSCVRDLFDSYQPRKK